MTREWGKKEKQNFIDRMSKLVHDLKNPFTVFMLLSSYLPPGEVISPELKRDTLKSIARVQDLQLQLERLMELYHQRMTDPEAFAMQRALEVLFRQFYAAATDFMNEEQPQKEAGKIGDQLIIAAVDLEEHLEKKIGLTATYKANTITQMAKLTKELAERVKKKG